MYIKLGTLCIIIEFWEKEQHKMLHCKYWYLGILKLLAYKTNKCTFCTANLHCLQSFFFLSIVDPLQYISFNCSKDQSDLRSVFFALYCLSTQWSDWVTFQSDIGLECRLDTVTDFLIKLGIKPCLHLVEIMNFFIE